VRYLCIFPCRFKTQLATLDAAKVLLLALFDLTKKKDHFGQVAEWGAAEIGYLDGTALELSTTNGTLYGVNTLTHQIDPFSAMIGGAETSVSAAPCGDNIFANTHNSGSISMVRITHQLEVAHTFKLSSRGSRCGL
jgi:hypothetical protein